MAWATAPTRDELLISRQKFTRLAGLGKTNDSLMYGELSYV